MKTSLKTALLVFALVFTSVQIFAQDMYNLSFKYEKGKTYFYRTNTNTETVQNMNGQENTFNSISKAKIKLDISDVTPTQLEMITSFDSLYTKTPNPQTGEDVINNGEGVVGKKTKMIYNIFGKKIKKIEIDAITSSNNMNMGENANLLVQLSEKPVKIGETWTITRTDTTKMGEDGKGIVKSDTEFKIDGKDKFNGAECLKISFKGTMKIEGSMTNSGYNMVIEGTGKTNGYLLFDYNKGILLSSNSGVDQNMTIAIPDVSMTIPMTQNIKSAVILTEK